MGVPQKINVQKAIKARLAGQSFQEIATAQGVSKSTVHDRIAPLIKALPNAEEMAEIHKTQADCYAVLAYRAVHAITNEKLENSSARDLSIVAGVATDKSRLISGQSTQNTAVIVAAAVIEADRLCSVHPSGCNCDKCKAHDVPKVAQVVDLRPITTPPTAVLQTREVELVEIDFSIM
jgi:predicted DNA-binding protein YlxM (UPF0122 family)